MATNYAWIKLGVYVPVSIAQGHALLYAGVGVRIPDTHLFTLKKVNSN